MCNQELQEDVFLRKERLKILIYMNKSIIASFCVKMNPVGVSLKDRYTIFYLKIIVRCPNEH